jgi:UDPglucose 6-dehydrogenase
MKKIVIIGSGYMVLITGAYLAEMGNEVTCLDINNHKKSDLSARQFPIKEPDLENLVKRGLQTGRLAYTTSYEQAMRDAEICFLALPTSSLPDESCDHSFVFRSATEFAKHLTDYLIVVNKSTPSAAIIEKAQKTIQRALKVVIIGSGYVGLVTGACLAEMGNKVTCLDIDHNKIDLLSSGQIPFYEPGLEDLVKRGLQAERLIFTTSYEKAMEDAEICFLALPTPPLPDGSCDYSFVFQAATEVAKHLTDYLIIVNKSTIPVGTTEEVRKTIQRILDQRTLSLPFDVVSNPEFLQEGTAIHNCLNPDRIILGVDSKRAQETLETLYAPFQDRIQVMDIPSAELAKYAANAMLATRISFMNYLSGLCEKVGGNIEEVRKAVGADPRIGSDYLLPGIGFGGSCLRKDVDALCAIAEEHDYPSAFFRSILEINDVQKKWFFQKILSYFGTLKGKTLAIWGLSFKPHTDDMRQAPSLDLIRMCAEHGAHLQLFDPIALPNAKRLLLNVPHLQFCETAYEAAKGADGMILVTEWPDFKKVDLSSILELMQGTAFFDGRNFFDMEQMEHLGFDYFCVGKKTGPLRERVE